MQVAGAQDVVADVGTRFPFLVRAVIQDLAAGDGHRDAVLAFQVSGYFAGVVMRSHFEGDGLVGGDETEHEDQMLDRILRRLSGGDGSVFDIQSLQFPEHLRLRAKLGINHLLLQRVGIASGVEGAEPLQILRREKILRHADDERGAIDGRGGDGDGDRLAVQAEREQQQGGEEGAHGAEFRIGGRRRG